MNPDPSVPPVPPVPPAPQQPAPAPVTGGDYVAMQDFVAWQERQQQNLRAEPIAPQGQLIEAINMLLLQQQQQGRQLDAVLREMEDQRQAFRQRLEEQDAARAELEGRVTRTIQDLQARSAGTTFEERAAATARISHDLGEARGTAALSVDAARRSTLEQLKREPLVPIFVAKRTPIGINGLVFTLEPGTCEVPASVAKQYHASIQIGEYAQAAQNVMSAEAGEVPEYGQAQRGLQQLSQQYGVQGMQPG